MVSNGGCSLGYSHYQFQESIETIGDTFIQIAASYGKASQQTSSQMMVSMMISSGICHIFLQYIV
jgi:hypothetical protein